MFFLNIKNKYLIKNHDNYHEKKYDINDEQIFEGINKQASKNIFV
jgi:hypothetical protein